MNKIFIILILFISSILAAEAPIVIGIAGGTGSGKTTLAKKILSSLPDAVLIEQDCYYKDLSHLSMQERIQTNFDHPNSIDFERLSQDIAALKNGQSIQKPIYNFKTHSRDAGSTLVEPANVIIVEGILVLTEEKIRDLFDLKIFVETDNDVRILRRIERDIHERGRDLANVKQQYLTTVRPMHNQFVEPSKQYADLILLGETDNSPAVKLILAGLRNR